jgi:hypothetical protein
LFWTKPDSDINSAFMVGRDRTQPIDTSFQLTMDGPNDLHEILKRTSIFNAEICWVKNDRTHIEYDPTHFSVPGTTEPSRLFSQEQCASRIGVRRVRGLFDSGSQDNFISSRVIQEEKIEYLIEDVDPITVDTLNGEAAFSKRIRLYVLFDHAFMGCTILFWVSDQNAVDIIIGEDWKMEHAREVFSRPACMAQRKSRMKLQQESKGMHLTCALGYLPGTLLTTDRRTSGAR